MKSPVPLPTTSNPYYGSAHITYPGNCLYYVSDSTGSLEVATRVDLNGGFPAGAPLSGLTDRPTPPGWDDTPWVATGASTVYFSRFLSLSGWPDIFEAVP